MKQSYKIPISLDKNYMDVEVALQAKSGVGLRPLPLRTILVWIAAVAIGFISLVSEDLPMIYLPIIGKIMYMGGLLGFVFFITARDSGGQSRFMAIRNMTNYMINKTDRVLKTRTTDNATAFANMVGIVEINQKTGMMTLNDGTYAYLYRVVGNASALLFDSDKVAIIDRVDNFYRKMPDHVRCEFITVKEPQKVVTQKLYMKNLYRNLDNTDKDIHKIMQESYKTLDEYVGNEFKSIHQYLMIVTGNKDDLNKAHTIVANEANNSSLMFNAMEPLYEDDILRLFHTIYSAD